MLRGRKERYLKVKLVVLSQRWLTQMDEYDLDDFLAVVNEARYRKDPISPVRKEDSSVPGGVVDSVLPGLEVDLVEAAPTVTVVEVAGRALIKVAIGG